MEKEPAKPSSSARVVEFWLCVWLGTVGAGGLFGALMGIIAMFYEGTTTGVIATGLGVIAGLIIAAVFAIPIVPTAAVLVWAFWLYRFRVLIAAIVGGATGLIAVIKLSNPNVSGSPREIPFATLACLLGTAGAVLAAMFHGRWTRDRDKSSVGVEKQVWQFTLTDLFVRITVIAILFPMWIWLVHTVQMFDSTRLMH